MDLVLVCRHRVILGLLVAACSSEAPLDDIDPLQETTGPAEGSSGVAFASDLPVADPGCIAPADVSAAPQSVEEAVQLINALPKPVTVACFLESLERPLDVELSRSIFSAQPSTGDDNPRIFIFYGDLVITVVPDGVGRELIEFGEVVAPARTVKAELELPLDDVVPLSAAFERIWSTDGTHCGGCHRGEEPTDEIPGVKAFVSAEYQPTYDAIVDIEDLRASYERCEQPDHRCEFLHAFFDHGEVRHRPFEEHVPTIFDED